MGQQINVNIRIDRDIKKQADTLFNDFGLSFTTAINAFIRQSLRERAIPFQIKAVKPSSERQELFDVFTAVQEQSVVNGTDKMTMEEIDAEIAAYRREKRAAE